MEPEFIIALSEAIANLWRVILIVCVTIVIIVLKEPLGEFIKRLVQLYYKKKEKDTETELSLYGEIRRFEIEAGKQIDPTLIAEGEKLITKPSDEKLDIQSVELKEDRFVALHSALNSQNFEE